MESYFVLKLLIALGWFLFLVGILCAVYGIYSLRIPKFHKSVRIFSFSMAVLLGFIGLKCVFFIEAFLDGKERNTSLPEKFYGQYEYIAQDTLCIELKRNGMFQGDSMILGATSGSWNWVDLEEYHFIEFYSTGKSLLKQLQVDESSDNIVLKTDRSVTNVENRVELEKR